MTLNDGEPGELEYGSILSNGEDWRLRRCDAGMGETEYRIFRNEKFFAMFDNRKDADIVMVAMTTESEQDTVLKELEKEISERIEHLKKMTKTETQLACWGECQAWWVRIQELKEEEQG
jgi:hypothetical protein